MDPSPNTGLPGGWGNSQYWARILGSHGYPIHHHDLDRLHLVHVDHLQLLGDDDVVVPLGSPSGGSPIILSDVGVDHGEVRGNLDHVLGDVEVIGLVISPAATRAPRILPGGS